MDDMTLEFLKNFHFVNETWVLILPCALMALDIVTGLIKAWKLKNFRSDKMRSGLAKKTGEIAIIVLGELFSFALGLPKYIMSFISLYIVLMELMSNLENIAELGVPLPKSLTNALQAIENTVQDGSAEEVKKITDSLKEGDKE